MTHPPFHLIFVKDQYGVESFSQTNLWGVRRLVKIEEARETVATLGRTLLYLVRVTPKDQG